MIRISEVRRRRSDIKIRNDVGAAISRPCFGEISLMNNTRLWRDVGGENMRVVIAAARTGGHINPRNCNC